MSTRAAAGALGAGLAAAVVGSVVGGAPRAVPDLAVTVVALGGGLVLGRVLPLRPRAMAAFLALASIGDITQFALSGGAGQGSPGGSSTAGAWQAYTVLRVALPRGHYDIGPLDLLLFTAIGEHWRRRSGSPLQSAAPSVLGMALVDLAPLQGSLPLFPFAFAGWLLTEGSTRLTGCLPHGTRHRRVHRRTPPAP